MYFGIRPDHFRMNDATDEEKLAWLREQGIKYTMSYRWTYGDSKESYELKKKTLRDLGMTSISAKFNVPSVAMLEYHDPTDSSPDQSDTILRCIDWAKENLTMLDWD